MRFSIIIPAHNAAEHIQNALDSVIEQTFTDYELIVVCDSCTDDTEQIAQEYGARTVAVEYHCDGPTRNRGIDLATGDWILFMDDDDWWLHEYVLEQINSKLTDAIDVLAFSFIWRGVKYASPRSNAGTLYPSVWNKCWRRSFIGSTRFPNVYSISDSYFHSEMMEKNPRIQTWDMPMYYYNYLRPGSISHEMGRTAPSTKEYWKNA